jgi:hypothetical protein
MIEHVSHAMRVASKEAQCSSTNWSWSIFEDLVRNADRVFCFDEGPRAEARIVAKSILGIQGSQLTLEGVLSIFKHRREAEGQRRRLIYAACAPDSQEDAVWDIRARPMDKEDIIRVRLEERSQAVEQMPESDGFWPVGFCLGE